MFETDETTDTYTVSGVAMAEQEEIATLVRTGKPLHRHHLIALMEHFVNSPSMPRMAVRSNRDLKSVTELYGMMCDIAASSEYFTFGKIEESEVTRLGSERLRMMYHTGVRYPYRHCVFHALPLSKAQGRYINMFQIVLDLTRAEDIQAGVRFRACIAEFACMEENGGGRALFAPTVLIEVQDEMKEHTDLNKLSLKVSIIFQNLRYKDGVEDEAKSEAQARIVLVANAYMNMLLHTKGLKVERIVPAEKLNKARARNGKRLLLPYTVVHTERFQSAVRETERMEQIGHRTSPKPHLRRGHPRHYKRDGRVIWIHDMIINCRDHNDFLAMREEYRVK